MHVMSSTSDMPVLQDYARPVLASLDSGKTNERKKDYPYCRLSCFVMFGITIFVFLSWMYRHKLRRYITYMKNIRF